VVPRRQSLTLTSGGRISGGDHDKTGRRCWPPYRAGGEDLRPEKLFAGFLTPIGRIQGAGTGRAARTSFGRNLKPRLRKANICGPATSSLLGAHVFVGPEENS